MKKLTYLILFICSILATNAQTTTWYNGVELKHGDLLFVGAKTESLSGAINRVTQLTDSAAFDHVGLIEVVDGIPYLLHASDKNGSDREPLDEVTKFHKKRLYAVYRVNSEFQLAIADAMQKAHQMLGKPYNKSFVLNDSSYYCSDYVERAFREVELFDLEPMTFINKETGKFDEYWVKFYKWQGIPVPEGELGCNPNGLAASNKIHKVGTLQFE